MRTDIQSDKTYWASFNRFELRIPGEAVHDIAQSGANDAAVEYWQNMAVASIRRLWLSRADAMVRLSIRGWVRTLRQVR